jgi:hypothetical protein
MSQVISEYLNFEWPSNTTEMFITKVNNVDNVAPASTTVTPGGEDIRIDGYMLNAATGLQFVPYGPSSAPPESAPTGPPMPGTPFPPGGQFNPVWTVPSPEWDPTYIVIQHAYIDYLMGIDILHANTWLKVLLTYDTSYKPIPIGFQYISMDFSSLGTTYEIQTVARGHDFSPITAWGNILLNGYVPPGWIPAAPVGQHCFASIPYPKTDQRPRTLEWPATSPVPGANAAAYDNSLPVVTRTAMNYSTLYIYGENLAKWNQVTHLDPPDPTLGITLDGVIIPQISLQYVANDMLIVQLPATAETVWGTQIVAIFGGKLVPSGQYYKLYQISVRAADKDY